MASYGQDFFKELPRPPKEAKRMDPPVAILSILGILGHHFGHFGGPGSRHMLLGQRRRDVGDLSISAAEDGAPSFWSSRGR